MTKHRILLGSLLAIAAALPIATPGRADARVFIGVGFGFPGIGFGFPYYAPYYYPPYLYRPYYYPPPAYYYPPPLAYAPPPAVYGAPPVRYGTAPASDGAPSAMARCVTGALICPLHYVKPVGEFLLLP